MFSHIYVFSPAPTSLSRIFALDLEAHSAPSFDTPFELDRKIRSSVLVDLERVRNEKVPSASGTCGPRSGSWFGKGLPRASSPLQPGRGKAKAPPLPQQRVLWIRVTSPCGVESRAGLEGELEGRMKELTEKPGSRGSVPSCQCPRHLWPKSRAPPGARLSGRGQGSWFMWGLPPHSQRPVFLPRWGPPHPSVCRPWTPLVCGDAYKLLLRKCF